MVRVVTALHDPSSQLLRALIRALSDGKLCVVDISQMRGPQGLALAGVILQRIFEHNQAEFTRKDSRSVPVIAVIEEAQSVLGSSVSQGEGPFVSWVKEGRKYDLGAVIVTQQPGSIPAEILSQGDNWFVFHLLAEGDLRALQKANAHFSDDLLSSLLNEPLPGHGVFWSSASQTPYPIPVRALLFEKSFQPADPLYDRPAVDCYASRLRRRLKNALDEAVAASGGQPVTVNQAVDATETFKTAAIGKLARDEQFQAGVQADQGIKWGFVQHKLAGYLPGTFGQDERERSDWVYKHGLVKRALNEILGENGWRSATRDGSQWVTATAQARSPGPPTAVADTSQLRLRHRQRECQPSPLRWSTMADTSSAGGVVSFDEVAWLRDNSPAWRLLRADNAPLVLSFLHQVFVTENVRSIPAAELASRLDDELYALNERGGETKRFPRPAKAYLDDWAAAGSWLAAQVLPGRHRRTPCRRHSRRGEGAAVGRQPERTRVRRHRVAAQHDHRPATADCLRHRDRPGATDRRAAAGSARR